MCSWNNRFFCHRFVVRTVRAAGKALVRLPAREHTPDFSVRAGRAKPNVTVQNVGQPFQAAGERGFPAPRPGRPTGRLESLPYLNSQKQSTFSIDTPPKKRKRGAIIRTEDRIEDRWQLVSAR